MDLPRHPKSEGEGTKPERRGGFNRGTAAVLVIAILLFAALVLLHLTGIIGPGSHG